MELMGIMVDRYLPTSPGTQVEFTIRTRPRPCWRCRSYRRWLGMRAHWVCSHPGITGRRPGESQPVDAAYGPAPWRAAFREVLRRCAGDERLKAARERRRGGFIRDSWLTVHAEGLAREREAVAEIFERYADHV